jgi:hypothetical protein
MNGTNCVNNIGAVFIDDHDTKAVSDNTVFDKKIIAPIIETK